MYINTFVARRLDELMCKLNDTRGSYVNLCCFYFYN